MKIQTLFLLALLLVSHPVLAQHTGDDHIATTDDQQRNSSDPSNDDEGTDEGCGNPQNTQPGGCEDCKDCEDCVSGDSSDSSDQSCEASSNQNSVHAYNGNAQRIITDLLVAGASKKASLPFRRYSFTRLTNRSLAQGAFGREGSWAHSYEWVLVDSGANRLTVTFPKGSQITFKPGNGSGWIPINSLSFLQDRLTTIAGGYRLDIGKNGSSVTFMQRTDANGGLFYRVESLTDSLGLTTTITYTDLQDKLMRRVTNSTGRWIDLFYNDMGTASQVGDTLHYQLIKKSDGLKWIDVPVTPVTPGASYRFLALYQGNTWRQKSPLFVKEIEFYDENNNLIVGGAPYGSAPYYNPIKIPANAFDGDLSTHYRYAYEKAAYVGIDLGVGNEKQVSRIRFYLHPLSLRNDSSITFVGQNAEAVPNWVISHVIGSDGRRIDYSYDVFTDASGWFQWVRLLNATYPDGAISTYSYIQTHDYTMPLLKTAEDPRFTKPLKKVRYAYSDNTVVGFVRDEYNEATGQKIVSTRWGSSGHKPKLTYSNGKVGEFHYFHGRMRKSIDSYGFFKSYTYTGNNKKHLASITDGLGRTTSYGRTSRGFLLSETSPAGRITAYTRDSKNRPLSITRNGNTTAHIRSASGKITRTDHPDGTYELWTHNALGQRLTHRMRNTHTKSWTYSAAGLLKTSTTAAGVTTTRHYYGDPGYLADPDGTTTGNVLGRLAATIDAYGNTTAYSYNDRGQPTIITTTPGGSQMIGSDTVQDTSADYITTTTNLYDDYGQLLGRTISSSDPNTQDRQWLYLYDSLGRKISTQDPDGEITLTSYDHSGGGCGGCGTSSKPATITTPDGRITKYIYDKEWRTISVTRRFGTAAEHIISYTYDGAGQRRSQSDHTTGIVTLWDYDVDGHIISTTSGTGVNGIITTPLATTTRTYDLDGNILTSTDPTGTITASTYDSMDRVITRTLASGTPQAATTSYTYSATTGELESITDPLGRITTFLYDDDGRRTLTTLPDGNTTENYYDLLGRTYKTRDTLGNFSTAVFSSQGQVVSTTSTAAITTTISYNGHGQRTLTTTPSGKTIATTYDAAGNITQTTVGSTVTAEILTRDNLQRPLTTKDGEGKITINTYEVITTPGELSNTSQDPLGNITTQISDAAGRLLRTVTADAITTATHTYDGLGRIATTTDGANRTLTYNYDASGRLSSYTDAKGAAVSFSYDPLGRLLSRTEPDATTQSYTYDLIGRLLTHTKADGTTKTHYYLNANRNELTKITYSNGEPDQSYTYSTAGQLLTSANQHATLTYGYDAAGRKTAETQQITGLTGTHTFSYTYNMDGQLATHTRPDGSLVEYSYNNRQLLAALTSEGPPPIAEYTYNGRSQLTNTKVENGLINRTQSYDNAGRLISVNHLDAGNASLEATTYTLNNIGQRTGITRNGQAETYGYDAARQLTTSTISGQNSTYGYDLAGNRATSTDIPSGTLAYTANSVNAYTLIGANLPTHDLNGNLTATGTGTTYGWDINNRLTTVSQTNGDNGNYGYDPQGRRVKRTVTIGGATSTTYYLTDGWNVELEHDGTTYTKRYSWGLDLSGSLQGAGGVGGLVMIEHLDSLGNVTTQHYPAYDGNGNVTALIDNSASIVATYRYDAYGNLLASTGGTIAEDNPYRFSTKPQDALTDLYYYGYRYYDPVTGRWPSRDPLGDEVFFQSYMRESLNNLNRKQLEEKIQSVKSETQKNLYAFVNNNSANSVDSFGLIGLTLVGCCSKKMCNIECTTANIAASIVCAGLDSVGVVDVQKCWDAVDEADRLCRKVCKKCILP